MRHTADPYKGHIDPYEGRDKNYAIKSNQIRFILATFNRKLVFANNRICYKWKCLVEAMKLKGFS